MEEELEECQWEYPAHHIQETVPVNPEPTVKKPARYPVLSEEDIDKVANSHLSNNSKKQTK